MKKYGVDTFLSDIKVFERTEGKKVSDKLRDVIHGYGSSSYNLDENASKTCSEEATQAYKGAMSSSTCFPKSSVDNLASSDVENNEMTQLDNLISGLEKREGQYRAKDSELKMQISKLRQEQCLLQEQSAYLWRKQCLLQKQSAYLEQEQYSLQEQSAYLGQEQYSLQEQSAYLG